MCLSKFKTSLLQSCRLHTAPCWWLAHSSVGTLTQPLLFLLPKCSSKSSNQLFCKGQKNIKASGVQHMCCSVATYRNCEQFNTERPHSSSTTAHLCACYRLNTPATVQLGAWFAWADVDVHTLAVEIILRSSYVACWSLYTPGPHINQLLQRKEWKVTWCQMDGNGEKRKTLCVWKGAISLTLPLHKFALRDPQVEFWI